MSQIKLDNDNYDLKFFTDELGELGLSPDKEQLDMFCRYYELLEFIMIKNYVLIESDLHYKNKLN